MARRKQRKALITYVSLTGNTEKIALRFDEVFKRYNWETYVLKITNKVDTHHPPVHIEDFDLVLAGSPVMAGLPAKGIFDGHDGIIHANLLKRPQTDRIQITENYEMGHKGIAFVTYGGSYRGPPEATPALDLIELRMEDLRIKCIGKFACPGGSNKQIHSPMDRIGDIKGWEQEKTATIIQLYKSNPNDPEFDSFSQEDRELFARLMAEEKAMKRNKVRMGAEHRRETSWHNFDKPRPSERDLLKADIFLSEIIEDFYGKGVAAAPLAQYVCLA